MEDHGGSDDLIWLLIKAKLESAVQPETLCPVFMIFVISFICKHVRLLVKNLSLF